QLAGLAELAQPYTPILFVLPAFVAAHPDLAAAFATRAAPVSGDRRPLRVAAESTWLPFEGRRRGLRLVHHGGGTVPAISTGARAVLTVHDLQYLRFPEHFDRVKRA